MFHSGLCSFSLMATLRKPLFFLLLLSLSVTQITSHTPSQTIEGHSSEPGDTDLKHELDRLKSKISSLESTIDERSRELSKKDGTIRDFEMAIQKKSESTSNSRARGTGLVKQVHGKWFLRWLVIPIYYIESFMVSCWNDYGRPALYITIQKALEKINQLKSWAALQLRNAIKHLISMMKDGLSKFIKFLASHLRSLPSKIIDVYDAFKNSLMPRLVYHWNDRGRPALYITTQKNSLMTHLVHHWNDRGRPALDITTQKTLEKIDQLKSWVGPQIRNVITHLIPMMKDGLSKFINYLDPHFWSLLYKTSDVYDASKNFLAPHLILTDGYIQEWKKFPELFNNHVLMVVTVLIVLGIIRVVMIFGITRFVIRLVMVVAALTVFWAAINWVLKKSTELAPVYLALA